jgi:hypothetical protein
MATLFYTRSGSGWKSIRSLWASFCLQMPSWLPGPAVSTTTRTSGVDLIVFRCSLNASRNPRSTPSSCFDDDRFDITRVDEPPHCTGFTSTGNREETSKGIPTGKTEAFSCFVSLQDKRQFGDHWFVIQDARCVRKRTWLGSRQPPRQVHIVLHTR